MAPSLKRHRRGFGRAPEFYGSDRGFFSEQNVASCKQDGVKVVCIPQRGGSKTPQRQAYEKSSAVQARPALSRRHRGAHLGAVARPRHEALPRRRPRALRVVCRRGGARQQPHEHRRPAGAAIVAPTKSRRIAASIQSSRVADSKPLRLTRPREHNSAPGTRGKNGVQALRKSRRGRQFAPFIGIIDATAQCCVSRQKLASPSWISIVGCGDTQHPILAIGRAAYSEISRVAPWSDRQSKSLSLRHFHARIRRGIQSTPAARLVVPPSL